MRERLDKMFITTYDTKEFGKILSKIRKSCNLTQQDIYNKVGISPETIRRLEKGDTIPTYDTIERLSVLYKENLLEILLKYKMHPSIYDIYKEIDRIITNKEPARFEAINSLIEALIDKKDSINLVDPSQLEQMIMLVRLLKTSEFHDGKMNDEYIKDLLDCISITMPNFEFEFFESFNYNHIELRILLLISLYYKKNDEFRITLRILLFIKSSIESKETLTNETIKILAKTICNISYTYYSIEIPEKSLEYANIGINLLKEHEINCGLYLLYARRAVAKILLDKDNYFQDILNSICLLDIEGKPELKETYIRVFKEKYKIILPF